MFKQIKKSFLTSILWLAGMLLATLPLVWLSIRYPSQLENMGHIITQNSWIFAAIRGLFILSVFLSWPIVIRYGSKQQMWSTDKTLFWMQKRLKITLWLVLFECLICENSVVMLMHWVRG